MAGLHRVPRPGTVGWAGTVSGPPALCSQKLLRFLRFYQSAEEGILELKNVSDSATDHHG